MDFKGETPVEATEALLQFVEALASEAGETQRLTGGGILHHKRLPQGGDIILELHFDSRRVAELKHKTNLFTSNFGSGRIVLPAAASILELRRDDEGMFRWHRHPARVSNNGKHVKPIRDAHWFPLVDEYMIGALSAPAKPPVPEKVHVMK